MVPRSLLVVLLAGCPSVVAAQPPTSVRAGPRELLRRDREIALARSAAPEAVSGDATVLVFTESGYVTAERGTNGVTCYVSRSWRDSLEPHCLDAEGSATILPVERERTMLRHRGASEVEVERAIADGLAAGRWRLPRRPAMSYMMSSSQVLYDDEGTLAGAWKPHLMIYIPYLKAEELGLGGPPSTEAALVFEEGEPFSSLVIVVRDFVDPVAADRARAYDSSGRP